MPGHVTLKWLWISLSRADGGEVTCFQMLKHTSQWTHIRQSSCGWEFFFKKHVNKSASTRQTLIEFNRYFEGKKKNHFIWLTASAKQTWPSHFSSNRESYLQPFCHFSCLVPSFLHNSLSNPRTCRIVVVTKHKFITSILNNKHPKLFCK